MRTDWKRCEATFAYDGDTILCLNERGHVGAHRAWLHHTVGECVEWETRPDQDRQTRMKGRRIYIKVEPGDDPANIAREMARLLVEDREPGQR